MEFSKKDLLSLLKEDITEMPMDFDTQDRPDQELQGKLAQGDTPLKKVPFPQTGDENKNFQELLASERYRQVVAKVREYTGIETPMVGQQGVMPLAQMMMTAHNQIIQAESAHKEELQQLAIELVMKEMSIPEGAINYDAKIVGMGEINTDDFNREMDQQEENIEPVDVEEDLADDLGTLNLEKAKRRLINSMIQGASKKGHYMYHYVADKIREITGSESLINQYGVLMSVNDTLYWQLSDDTMKAMMGGGGGGGSVGGKERVDRNTNPPTIYAEGLNFPILVHELIKGTLELFAIQGRPTDAEGNEDPRYAEVEQSEDTLEKEVWDLRLGPAIWERVRRQFPDEILLDENKLELQNYLFVEIVKLPAKNFLVFMKEVVSGSENGKRLMDELMQGVDQMFKNQDYQNAMDAFNNDLNNITDDTDDDDLGGFLDGLGIRLSDDDE
jgi:hypothetical protein